MADDWGVEFSKGSFAKITPIWLQTDPKCEKFDGQNCQKAEQEFTEQEQCKSVAFTAVLVSDLKLVRSNFTRYPDL